MSTAIDVVSRALFRSVTFTSTRPKVYYGLRQLLGQLDEFCVTRDTDLVIEGFPRSANSTTVSAFLDRQPRPIRVSHHKHHAAQLLRAADLQIPAAVLIRRPADAVLSYLALIEQARTVGDKAGRAWSPGFAGALHAYVAFYRATVPILDCLVIAPFAEVTVDVGSMIERLNQKFGTDFASAAVSPPSFADLGWHATPHRQRDCIKESLAARLQPALEFSRHLQGLMKEADDLHQRIMEEYDRRR